MKPELINLLRAQARMEFDLQITAEALSLWAKSEGWAGSHKWFGEMALEWRTHVKGINKFILDFADAPAAWPSSDEKECASASLADAYGTIAACLQNALGGWEKIYGSAAMGESRTLETFADRYQNEYIDWIKKLARFGRLLAAAGDNFAALMAFDKARG